MKYLEVFQRIKMYSFFKCFIVYLFIFFIFSNRCNPYIDKYNLKQNNTFGNLRGIAFSERQGKSLEIDQKKANQRANRFIDERRYDEAERILIDVLRFRPQNKYTLSILAKLYLRKGDYRRSIEYAKQALGIDPQNTPPRTLLAQALMKSGRFDEAIAVCKETIRIKKSNIPPRVVMAQSLFQLRRYDDTIKVCDEILKINPKNIPAFSIKSDAYFALKKYEEVIKICDYVIRKISATEPRFYLMKIESLINLNRLKEAVDIVRDTLKIPIKDPKRRMAILMLGVRSFRGLDRNKDALSLCQIAVKMMPDNIYAKTVYADALRKAKQYDGAEKVCFEVLEKESDNVPIRTILAQIYLDTNRPEEAIVFCDQAIRLWPGDNHAKVIKVKCLRRLKRYNEALDLVDASLKDAEKKDDIIPLLITKIQVLIELKKFDDAINLCDKVLGLSPNNRVARIFKADSLRKKRPIDITRLEEAKGILDRLLIEKYEEGVYRLYKRVEIQLRKAEAKMANGADKSV